MVKLSRVLKRYRETGAMGELVNLYGFVDEHTFLTKSGDLGVVIRVRGVDYECLDHEQLDQVARRLQSALKIFDERFRIYQYLLKRDNPLLPQSEHENPVVQQAIASRSEYLRTRADRLFSQEVYFVVMYEGWRHGRSVPQFLRQLFSKRKAAFGELFSTRKRILILEEELDRAREVLSSRVNSFLVQITDLIGVTLLSKREAFTFLRRLFNFAPYKAEAVSLKYDTFLDYYVCDEALECYRTHLRLGDHYVKVLSLKEPPSQTFANLLGALQEIPSNFIVVSEWRREDNSKMRREIQKKRRHFHNAKHSMINYLIESNQDGGPAAPGEMLTDDAAVGMVADLGSCLRELEINGNYFGRFSMSVVLYGPDRPALERSSAEFFKIFSSHDGVLLEETYNLLNAFLAIAPGNSIYNLRYLYLLNTNYADLSLPFTLDTGEPHNAHLGKEYLAVLETEHQQPYFFNLHHGDVGHSLVLGATGSGKSFLLNFLITHLQKYAPCTFIFDLGGSYRHLTRLFSGAYVPVEVENRSFVINPFCLPATEENFQFLFSFVKVLIESGGYNMEGTEERDLYEQIKSLYEVDPDQRRLFTLSNILSRNLRIQLHKWVQGGQYASVFDNIEDNLTLSRFQCFDFEGMEKYPQILEPLLFYILHRANACIHDSALATTLKVFVMDEAWRFMRNDTIKLYVTQALKTWRKRNGAMILATQSSADLEQTDMLPIVLENCPTTIFLANPGMDREVYRRIFNLNHTETELIARLIPKRQILLKRPDIAKVLNLNVESKGYWLYTSDPYDNQHRNEVFERLGFQEGLEALARDHTILRGSIT